VEVSEGDRTKMEERSRAQSIPHALATRTRIVLGSAADESVRASRGGFGYTTVMSVATALPQRRAGQAADRPRAGGPAAANRAGQGTGRD
jgi:hypothetical protein